MPAGIHADGEGTRGKCGRFIFDDKRRSRDARAGVKVAAFVNCVIDEAPGAGVENVPLSARPWRRGAFYRVWGDRIPSLSRQARLPGDHLYRRVRNDAAEQGRIASL